MNRIAIVLLSGALATAALHAGRAEPAQSADAAVISAAIADQARPESDRARDADRKPAETLAFAGVKSGDRVADYAAGGGYFTRLFAAVVSPTGHVYAVVPSALFQYPNIVKGIGDIESYAVDHPNVTVSFGAALAELKFPERLGLFWISQNYHDLHDRFMGPVDIGAFNRAVFSALKPGGCYVVLDHAAAPGAPGGRHRNPASHRCVDGTPRSRGCGLQIRRPERCARQRSRSAHCECVRRLDPRSHRPVHSQVPEAAVAAAAPCGASSCAPKCAASPVRIAAAPTSAACSPQN